MITTPPLSAKPGRRRRAQLLCTRGNNTMLGVQDVRVHAPADVDLSTYPLQFSLSCGPLRVA